MNELVPIYHKYALTITEASKYFNIGRDKLYRLLEDDYDFILRVGTKSLIKRKKFEQFLDAIDCV